MNIWMPYANSMENMKVLDDAELFDIVFVGIDTLRYMVDDRREQGRLALMWAGRPGGLLAYVTQAHQELAARGQDAGSDNLRAFSYLSRSNDSIAARMPHWFGEPKFHLSHRSRLIRINPEHYAHRLPPDTPLDLPLYWPRKGMQ